LEKQTGTIREEKGETGKRRKKLEKQNGYKCSYGVSNPATRSPLQKEGEPKFEQMKFGGGSFIVGRANKVT